MKTVRIALIGYGNVGKAFAAMLLRKEEYIREAFDAKAIITGICTKSRGVCLRPEGIDKTQFAAALFERCGVKVLGELSFELCEHSPRQRHKR